MGDQLDEIVKEGDKAEPQIPVTTPPRDLKQRVASVVFDFGNRAIVINIDEGEDQGNGFVRVGGIQKTLDTKTLAQPLIAAIANKAQGAILNALATSALAEGIKEVPDE